LTLDTVHKLGDLHGDQGKLGEAEQMYFRALAGKEKALGPDHTSTLDTVNSLGKLYRDQGKLDKAEQMYLRALDGKEKALGPDHKLTLDTVHNLGIYIVTKANWLRRSRCTYVRWPARRRHWDLNIHRPSTLSIVSGFYMFAEASWQSGADVLTCAGRHGEGTGT